ncbi:MAG: Uncharacterized protein G01um101493_137 [Microgenomates group bacterium Gr01-1014_93]|nr:MAG: Uncharacterized protein G01um101493_137 [Microgenomates group bacterium Gr01-1014_93]
MKKLLATIIIFLFILMVARGWWTGQLSPVSNEKQEKTIIIANGLSVDEITQKLKKENLIRSETAFKLLVKQKGAGDKLQAGTFKLSPSMSAEEILKALMGGPVESWVTLLEGWRKEEMAKKLNEDLGIDSKEFIKNAKEGYMFPDTYLFSHDVTVEQITKTMRDNFERRFSDDLRLKIKAKGLTEAEGVILASIVEREGRSDKVRQEVASILLKRLKIGMKLDVDATIQYALGFDNDEKTYWRRHITKEEKQIKSPYNTYTNPGLPPGPICNPGLSSLQAVANADPSTPYLYYYHDSKGNSHYAKTLDEHLENVANNP